MTSSMTSQGGLKIGRLYPFMYEITFFMITKQTTSKYIIKLPVHMYHEFITTII